MRACAAGAGQTIVFGDTKSDVDETASQLAQTIAAKALHGDIAQSQREVTLKSFKNGGFSVLVATDVAARGLDISSAPPSACLPAGAQLHCRQECCGYGAWRSKPHRRPGTPGDCLLHRGPLARRQREHLHHVKKSAKALVDTHSVRVAVLTRALCTSVLRAAGSQHRLPHMHNGPHAAVHKQAGWTCATPTQSQYMTRSGAPSSAHGLWCVRRVRVQSSRSAANQRPIVPPACMPAVTGELASARGTAIAGAHGRGCAVQTWTS